MGIVIHARRRGEETIYRVWSSYTDRYISSEMNKDECRGYMMAFEDDERDIELERVKINERLDRAGTNGTSELFRSSVSIGNEHWDPERVKGE